MNALDRVRRRRELEEAGATDAELEAFELEEYGDPNELTPAERRRFHAQSRRRGRAQNKPIEDAYRAGRRDTGGTRRSSSRPASRARSSARRAGRQSYRQMSRELQAPVQTSLAGGVRVISMSLLLIGLYLALTNSGPFTGVLQGLSKGLSWLADPHVSIPYGPGYRGD